MPSYLPFKEIAESIDVEAVAKHVGVALKRSGKELRGACPSCRSDEERSLALFPETNSFRCYASQLSGDSIALYGHLTGTGMYQSAKHLQDQFAPATAGRQNTAPATAPQKPGFHHLPRLQGRLRHCLGRRGRSTQPGSRPSSNTRKKSRCSGLPRKTRPASRSASIAARFTCPFGTRTAQLLASSATPRGS